MATIIINGQEHELPEGEKLNAIQAATRAGVDIPYYCWHPALSVVANCRMCEVEVGQKDARTGEIKMIPKLVPGLPDAGQGRDGDRHRKRQGQGTSADGHGVSPDQPPARLPGLRPGGDVRPPGLFSFEYGQSSHRFVEERVVNPRKEVSDAIQLNQDRCIMCTRCVRFTREITQTGELQVMRRGKPCRDRRFPGPSGRQPPGGQCRRPVPRRRPARQGFPPQAAGLVPVQARRHLHSMLDRLQRQGRGKPRASSGDSPPATTPWSTTSGSATRAGPVTRRPMIRIC